MKKLFPVALFAAVSFAGNINISTGQNQPDPVWTITAGGSGPAQVISNPVSPPWVVPPAGSAWVSTSTDVNGGASSYSLSTTFNNTSSAVLTFRALADNELRVYINNSATPIYTFTSSVASDFVLLPPTQTVNLAAGPTTIRLDVINQSGPTGVLFVGNVSDVPEPSTFGILGAALLSVGLLRRSRQRP
jgi:hypothetical protein